MPLTHHIFLARSLDSKPELQCTFSRNKQTCDFKYIVLVHLNFLFTSRTSSIGFQWISCHRINLSTWQITIRHPPRLCLWYYFVSYKFVLWLCRHSAITQDPFALYKITVYWKHHLFVVQYTHSPLLFTKLRSCLYRTSSSVSRCVASVSPEIKISSISVFWNIAGAEATY